MKAPIHNVEHFYKYMTRATGRAVLENRTLRWSTPGTLNDPYDVQFDLQLDINGREVREKALDKLWDAFYHNAPVVRGNQFGIMIATFRDRFPRMSREEFDEVFSDAIDEGIKRGGAGFTEVQETLRTELAKAKILCLTESPDNTLMWTHYAENHQGIVVRFRSLPEIDSPYAMAQPIQYVRNMPKFMDEDFLSDLLSGRVTLEPRQVIEKMIYTKSVHWAYEREWRIDAGDGRDAHAIYEDIPFNRRELDGVIFGCRMGEEDRKYFTSTIRRAYPHVWLYETRKHDRVYGLEIRQI